MGKAITKSELIEMMQSHLEVDKKTVKRFFEVQAELAYQYAKDKFTIPGIGFLILKDRPARIARNPRTGEKVKVPAKTVLKFRIAKVAKESVVIPKKKKK